MEHLTEVERFHRVVMATLHEALQPRLCAKGMETHQNHHSTYFMEELRKCQDVLTQTDRHLRNYHSQLAMPEVEPQLPSLESLQVIMATKPIYKHQFRNMYDLFQNILDLTKETYDFERDQLADLCKAYGALGQTLTLHLKDTLAHSLCEPLGAACVSYTLEPSESQLRATIRKLYTHQTKLYKAVRDTQETFLPLLPDLFALSKKHRLITAEQQEEYEKLAQEVSLDALDNKTLNVTPRLQAMYSKMGVLMDSYLLAASKNQKRLVTFFKDMESKQRQATHVSTLAQENLKRYYHYLKDGKETKVTGKGDRLTQMFEYDKQTNVLQESCHEIVCKLRELQPKHTALAKAETQWKHGIRALETWKSVKRALIEYSKEERSMLNHYKKARWNYYRTIQEQTTNLTRGVQTELDMYLQANTKLVSNLFAALRKKHQFAITHVNKKWEDTFIILNKRFKHLHLLQEQTSDQAPKETQHFRAYESQCGKTIENLREYAEQRFNHEYYSSLVLHMGYARQFLSNLNDSKSEVNCYLTTMDKFCETTQPPYIEATNFAISPLEKQIKTILQVD